MAVPSNKSPLSTSRVRKPAAPKKNTPVPSVFVAVIKGNLPESSTTAEPPDPKKAHPPMTGAVIQNVISHDASVITICSWLKGPHTLRTLRTLHSLIPWSQLPLSSFL